MKISQVAARIADTFGALPVARCAALVGTAAVLAFAPAAHAVVTVSPAANIAVPVTTAGIYINVVSGVSNVVPANAPGWDINPWGSGSAFIYAGSGGGLVSSTNSPIAALSVGTTIDATSTFSTASPGAATFGALAGQWTLNATNYFGFKFIGDDTLLHYGYGTMIVGATALNRTVGNVWYESAADTGITITAVPEPSSYALMLLGAVGVVGAAARRRKAA